MIYIALGVLVITTIFLWIKKKNAFDPGSVRGRNVLITGASSGIGEELAYHYARLHANVMITARREDLLKKVRDKCETLSCGRGKFFYRVSDLGNYKTEAKPLIDECVKKFGGLDTIILNHAYFGTFTVWTGSEEDLEMFEKSTDVNYSSYVYIMSYALPYLQKSVYGRIGVIGSIAGKFGWPLLPHYSGGKFALDGFFSSFRGELQQAKVKMSLTYCALGFVATQKVMDAVQSAMERYMTFGSGNNLDRNANHVIGDIDDVSYQVLKATETGKRELYYPKWYGGLYCRMPTYCVPLVRHFLPTWVANVSWKPQFFKDYRAFLEQKS